MDYKSLGNIFKGLACSGSWGCFDEFNRLIPEVLSVCTVQFKAVCYGVARYEREHASSHQIVIEGDGISLDPTCGAFITMNPVTRPQNLSFDVLIRPSRDILVVRNCRRGLKRSFGP